MLETIDFHGGPGIADLMSAVAMLKELNTVTVTIGRLRRKLGEPPVIAATPGVGYRVVDEAPTIRFRDG
ncbi:hypothetical protein GCM10023195_69290 [Actinoallomurus liliacearum]|uniref:OmpR/PhoB-type domain-containing protein n=1 Tax=Actinoallomurus liliacearum TaxID=1080073 RepID=A0ABP8TTA8_9ACTN